MTRLNIPVMHLLKLQMGKTGMIGSWSQYPGLVSKHITKIDKIIIRRSIMNNLVLPNGMGIDISRTIIISELRVTEERQNKKE